MSFPFFPLGAFIILLPVVLSLDRAPEALKSTATPLRGMRQSNSGNDCLGSSLTHALQGSVKVTTKGGTVHEIAADQIVDIIFNYTSPSGKDYYLVAQPSKPCPCRTTLKLSDVISTGEPSSTPITETGVSSKTTPAVWTSISPEILPSPTLPVAMNMPSVGSTIPSKSSVSESATATPVQSTTKAVPPEAIVGIAVGSFAFLLSVLLAFFVWRRRNRQKAKESAPSRVFWRSLDDKSSPVP